MPQGNLQVTEDGESAHYDPDHFYHCKNPRCPICLRFNCIQDAWESTERLMSARKGAIRNGHPHATIFAISISPPRTNVDPFANLRWYTYQAYLDLRAYVTRVLMDELGALGGILIPHHFREDGEDGIENASRTGNTGDPDSWRTYDAEHFHALVVMPSMYFPLTSKKCPGLARLRELGWVIKLDQPKPGADIPKCALRGEGKVSAKIEYLLSHASIIEPLGGKCSRALDRVTYFGCAHHSSLPEVHGVGNHPLLNEGRTAVDERGQTLYWLDLVPMALSNGSLSLAEVEELHSGRVFCLRADKNYCRGAIEELCDDLGIDKRYREYNRKDGTVTRTFIGPSQPIPIVPLWNRIRDDRAFITIWKPYDAKTMRNPLWEKLDGGQNLMRLFAGEPLVYSDDGYYHERTPFSEDYERYCDERDEWLDEYNRQHGTSLRV